MERAINTFWSAACVVWLVAMVATFAGASPPPLTLTDAGYYLTYVDESGVPSMVPVESVTDLRSRSGEPVPPIVSVPPTQPVPPTTPDTPPVDIDVDVALVKSVQSWAVAIDDPDGSQAVAAVYSHVRGAFDDGTISESDLWSTLKAATDDALTITSPAVNWSTFRTHLSDVITLGRQKGELTGQLEVNKVLDSIKHGLDLSADGKPMLSDAKLVAIAVKTNEVIDAR